jgi:hypothetical protein
MAYCVFWYPRTYHGVIEIRKEISSEREITGSLSDEPNPKYRIMLNNSETNGKNEHGVPREDIEVVISEGESEIIRFTLEQRQASRNGLVLYEYDENCLPEELREQEAENLSAEGRVLPRQAFWSAIYHLSKDFYHVHEFHDDKTDSIILPYMNGCNNIQENNNEALIHYLNCYENKFCNYLNYSKNLLGSIEKKHIGKVGIKTLMKYKPTWDEIFYRIRGAHIYYKTLVGSKYLLPANNADGLHRLILGHL